MAYLEFVDYEPEARAAAAATPAATRAPAPVAAAE
jgi:hypothetical protein